MADKEQRVRNISGTWLKVGEGRALAVFHCVVVAALAGAFAFGLRPEPASDWEYYWLASDDLSRYERGGGLLFLLGAIKQTGWPPFVVALAANVPMALLILWTVRRIDRSPGLPAFHLVAGCLVLLTPYFGVFQLDLLSAGFLLLAFVLVFMAMQRPRRRWPVLAWAVALAALAVSSRPQFVLVLPVACVALTGIALLRGDGRRDGRVRTLVAVLMLGVAGGFALDSSLRAMAERSGAIRSTSAVTLYAGLLASGTEPPCGLWSPAATDAMREDLDTPLPQAIVQRLQGQPASHWGRVMACKVPDIVFPPAFALGWVLYSPEAERPVAAIPSLRRDGPEAMWGLRIEHHLFRGMTLVLYAFAVLVALRAGPVAGSMAVLPLVWLGSFWVVHLVFEIQGRYFLATLLMVPVLCALVLPPRGSRAQGEGIGRMPAAAGGSDQSRNAPNAIRD